MNNNFQININSLVGGLSKSKFAEKCDIKQTTMTGYLNGTSQPNLENLLKIAKANNVSVGWLAGEEDQNRKPSIIQPHFPNKSMQELAQWIAEQGDTINYWEVVKAMMARDYPEFDEWLKKRQGENPQIDNQSLVGNDK